MRINIQPVEVDGQVTTVGEVSLALSTSAAIRVVPVVDDVPVDAAGFGVVGYAEQEDVAALMTAVGEALTVFLAGRDV